MIGVFRISGIVSSRRRVVPKEFAFSFNSFTRQIYRCAKNLSASFSIETMGDGHLFATLTLDLSGTNRIRASLVCLSIYFQVCKCFNSCDVNQVSNSASDAIDSVAVFTIATKHFSKIRFTKTGSIDQITPPSYTIDETLVIKCNATNFKIILPPVYFINLHRA